MTTTPRYNPRDPSTYSAGSAYKQEQARIEAGVEVRPLREDEMWECEKHPDVILNVGDTCHNCDLEAWQAEQDQ